MKRNTLLLIAVFSANIFFGQSNKFEDINTSKKLAISYRSIKDKDKEDYFQQYFWLVKAEQLKAYPHLAKIKSNVLYQFVKEIYPENPTKKLTKEEQALRKNSELALEQLFLKKDYTSQLTMDNVISYVDPSKKLYFTEVNPEKISEIVPKQLYSFTSLDKRTKNEKSYFLWIDEDKFRIMSTVPPTEDKKFYQSLEEVLPNYKFSSFAPEVKKGNKADKNDADYFYITPFQEGNENIQYRTDDFKKFELVKYKEAGGAWELYDKKKKKK
ncbi:MAG: hypothetical protein JST62_04975 [Bacteroidetes bacterium]|jgi:hypothetical protein|nr:hypothetical protein [Bacteroidota bacterium]